MDRTKIKHLFSCEENTLGTLVFEKESKIIAYFPNVKYSRLSEIINYQKYEGNYRWVPHHIATCKEIIE